MLGQDCSQVKDFRVIGIDGALRRTGVCTNIGGIYTPGLVLGGKLRGTARLESITDQIAEIVEATQPSVAAIESGSFGSVNRAHALGEVSGTIKLMFRKRGVDILEVAPRMLKLFATGSGSATKARMIAAVLRRYGIDVAGDDDLADSVALARFAEISITGVSEFRSELEVIRRFHETAKPRVVFKKVVPAI